MQTNIKLDNTNTSHSIGDYTEKLYQESQYENVYFYIEIPKIWLQKNKSLNDISVEHKDQKYILKLK